MSLLRSNATHPAKLEGGRDPKTYHTAIQLDSITIKNGRNETELTLS